MVRFIPLVLLVIVSSATRSVSVEDIELDVGGTKFKGVWIAILFSFASTIGGGIWTASEFFNRLGAQEQAVQEAVQVAGSIEERFNALKDSTDVQINAQKNLIDVMKQQLNDNDVAGLQGKLASLGTNLESIMQRQSELLDMRDKIAEIEKISSELNIKTTAQLEKLNDYDKQVEKLTREINDLWNGMDALRNPLN